MELAIRNADGTMIGRGTYTSMKGSAQAIARNLLELPAPLTSDGNRRSKTKNYFTSFHSQEWNDAIAQLEEKEPLLALCAGHWKASHLVGQCLSAAAYPSQQRSRTTQPSSKRHKKRHQSPSMDPPAPKKSRTNETDNEGSTGLPISTSTTVPKTKVTLETTSFGSRTPQPPVAAVEPKADADIIPSSENLISMSHPRFSYLPLILLKQKSFHKNIHLSRLHLTSLRHFKTIRPFLIVHRRRTLPNSFVASKTRNHPSRSTGRTIWMRVGVTTSLMRAA